MTQTVAVPADLEALLAFRFHCKARIHGLRCGSEAKWLARVICEGCGPRTTYLCNLHAVMGDVERCDALGWRCIPHACFVNVIALYPFG
jgi:hypothetical protein